MLASFNEIGWVEIAANWLLNFWEMLQQRPSNAKIPDMDYLKD